MLYVWTSTQSALFVQQPSIVISQDSTFTVTILPDSMMTITTISTGNKGNFSDSPIPGQVLEVGPSGQCIAGDSIFPEGGANKEGQRKEGIQQAQSNKEGL
jgi:hypothetical protein